jgi:hypothetical protein
MAWYSGNPNFTFLQETLLWLASLLVPRTTFCLQDERGVSRFLRAVAHPQHRATFRPATGFYWCMRFRLAIYGFASLLLLALYAPARALSDVLLELRQRFISL